jgi:hypothetical protein
MPRPTVPVVLISLWLATWCVAMLAGARAYGAPAQDQPLRAPEPKPCVDGAAWAELAGDTGFYAPEGLSQEDIGSAMDAFLPTLQRCVPPGRALSAQLTVRMEVACDGRVRRVSTVEEGSLDAELERCLVQTLRYAELPAHDAHEGFEFDYRLRLMFVAPPVRRGR